MELLKNPPSSTSSGPKQGEEKGTGDEKGTRDEKGTGVILVRPGGFALRERCCTASDVEFERPVRRVFRPWHATQYATRGL